MRRTFDQPIRLVLSLSLLLATATTQAAALGQPVRQSMFGYGLGATSLSVDDPDGVTDETWAFVPLSLIYTARLASGIRYWSELDYLQTQLDASTTHIGQDVRQLGLRLSLQKSLPISPGWITWFGMGLGVRHDTYTARHTIDNEGFLRARFADRRETRAEAVLNFMSEWSLGRDWRFGLKLEQALATSSQAQTRGLLNLLYRYRNDSRR